MTQVNSPRSTAAAGLSWPCAGLLVALLAGCQGLADVEEKNYVEAAAGAGLSGGSGQGGAGTAGAGTAGAGTAGAGGQGGEGGAGASGAGQAGVGGDAGTAGAAGEAGAAGAAGDAGAAGAAGDAGQAGQGGAGAGGESGSSGQAGSEQGPLHRPPLPPPLTQLSGSTETLYLAVRNFYFGTKTNSAWRLLGFDQDGLNTDSTKTSSASYGGCKKPSNAALVNTEAFEDGIDGIDNVFGQKLAPLFKVNGQTLEQVMNKGINETNSSTLMFVVSGLDKQSANQSLVSISVYLTANEAGLGKPVRTWTTKDDFAINQLSLNAAKDINNAKLIFNGYMTDDTIVATRFENASNVDLPLDLGDFGLITLRPEKVLLTIELNSDHTVVNGATMGLILEPNVLVESFKMPLYKAGTCLDGLYKFAQGNIPYYVDLADNAPLFEGNQGLTCSRTSMGIGMDLARVGKPATILEYKPPAGLCDLGTGGAAGMSGAGGTDAGQSGAGG